MARHNEPSPFEGLVRAHHAAVWRAAHRILRSDASAQDVTQEVFLRVLDGRLRLASSDEAEVERVLRWWAVRIALTERRGTARRAAREERHAMERPSATHAAAEVHDQSEPSLWRLVDELPEELRVPLLLRFAEGIPFAGIGEAIGVAESTAHERVGRALGRLRQRLAQIGLGAWVPALEERLVDGGVGAAAAPPPALAARLLALEGAGAGATTGLSAGLAVGLALGALAALGAALGALGGGGARGAAQPSHAVSLAVAPVPSDGPPAGAVDAPAPLPRAPVAPVAPVAPEPFGASVGPPPAAGADLYGTVVGRVVDSRGGALADAPVTVFSVERSGKLAAYVAKATTDASGRFSTEVGVADANGGGYQVQVSRLGYSVTSTTPQRVRAGATTDFGSITVDEIVAGTAGEVLVEALLLDTGGRPVAGAKVELGTVVDLPLPEGEQRPQWSEGGERLERIDDRGITDVGGLVRLRGEGSGKKLLRAKPTGGELAPLVQRFDAAPGDAPRIVLVAEPGRTITGQLVAVEGGVPQSLPRRVRVFVRERLSGEWIQGNVAADGTFEVRGLPAGLHRVEVDAIAGGGPSVGRASDGDAPEALELLSPTWFDVEIAPDAAGSAGHVIALKREDDPRDVGHHAAELHGRLLKAEDGSPLVVDCWAVDLDPAPELELAELRGDWLPNHLFPRPVQRAWMGTLPPDSDRFHLTGLAGGRYVLHCNTPGRAAMAHGPFELAERDVQAGLQLRVEPPARLEGRVLDPDGDPIEGAFVLVTGVGPYSEAVVARGDAAVRAADGRGYLFVNGTEERTDGGAFVLDRLPPGLAVRLVALHPTYAPALGPLVTLERGESRSGLELRFRERAAQHAR